MKVYKIKHVGGADGEWKVLLEGSYRRFSIRDLLKLTEREKREKKEHAADAERADVKASARTEAVIDHKHRRVANLRNLGDQCKCVNSDELFMRQNQKRYMLIHRPW